MVRVTSRRAVVRSYATVTPSNRMSRRASGTVAPSAARGAVGAAEMVSASSSAASPSMLAWKRLPAARSGRYASGVSSSTSSAVCRASPPPSNRMPTGTATSATERVATSSSTSAERNAIRSVFMVATRCPSAIRRTTSVCARARPNARSVGNPATMSRKCPPSSESRRHCRSVAAWACQPSSAPKTGISGRVTAMITAELQSAKTTRASTASGTVTLSTSCGQVSGEVGVQRVQPAPGQGGDLTGPLPGHPAGPVPADRAEQVGPQRRLDRGGDPRRDRALRPDQRRAGSDRDHEAAQRRPIQSTVDRGGQHRREGGGLRHDQPGGEHTEEREHGKIAPGRRDPAQQTRVERTAVHQYTGALPSVRPRKTHQHIAWKPSRAGSSGSATQPSSRSVGALAAASVTVSEAPGSVVDTST